MRILSSELTTAQKSASRKPYIKIEFLSLDGATTKTYQTTDTPNKIEYVYQVETQDALNNISTPIGEFAAIIRIRDVDNTQAATDFRGNRVHIHWGLNTTAGDESSLASVIFVFSTRRVSNPQDNYIEMLCISLWELAQYRFLAIATSAGTINYLGDKIVRHILMDLLGGNVAFKVFIDDAGVFTDETDDGGIDTDGG